MKKYIFENINIFTNNLINIKDDKVLQYGPMIDISLSNMSTKSSFKILEPINCRLVFWRIHITMEKIHFILVSCTHGQHNCLQVGVKIKLTIDGLLLLYHLIHVEPFTLVEVWTFDLLSFSCLKNKSLTIESLFKWMIYFFHYILLCIFFFTLPFLAILPSIILGYFIVGYCWLFHIIGYYQPF